MEENDLTREQEESVVLEAVKYYVAFGAPKELDKEIIQGIAQELDRLQISGKTVLRAIAEVKARGEVEDIFDEAQNIVPFTKRALTAKKAGGMRVHTLECCNDCDQQGRCHYRVEDCLRAKQSGYRVVAATIAANISKQRQPARHKY